jgi:hypothetical protein
MGRNLSGGGRERRRGSREDVLSEPGVCEDLFDGRTFCRVKGEHGSDERAGAYIRETEHDERTEFSLFVHARDQRSE